MDILLQRQNQCRKILSLLEERDEAGASSAELYKICCRPGSRLFELRRHYVIETVRESAQVYRYILRGRKLVEDHPKPEPADQGQLFELVR